tara:strand:+ start:4649 stop:5530 length:882 start_codon:yes stop_codon:yes gene_type:complete
MAQKILDSISNRYIRDIHDKNRLSGFVIEKDYQLLFLRELSPESDDIEFNLHCFLFKDDKTYLYNSDQNDFVQANKNTVVVEVFSSLFSNSRVIIQEFSQHIENLEDSLFTRSFPQHFMDMWFDLRNELSKIDRYNLRLIEVIQDFHNQTMNTKRLTHSQYLDVTSNINFIQSKIKDELARLDMLHHYYLSIKGDRLNKSIYLLTVISGLFLPLNLIVGFFGMNTEGLLFKDNPEGTMYVIYTLLGLVGVMLFSIPIFQLFDRLVLRYFLGKFDLYKKLNSKVDSLSKTFKVE